MTKEKKETKQEFKSISEVLHFVQMNLKAPKNQVNKFGGYKYRSCEDILEGLKQVMPEGAYVTVSDDIVCVSDRVYVKATAALCYGDNCISNTSFAREELQKKGMDSAQLTGSTSSYARKYALNGLFLIDDVKDADSQDNSKAEQPKEVEKQKTDPQKELYTLAAKQLKDSKDIEVLKYVYEGLLNDINTLPKAGQDALKTIYDKKLFELSQAPLGE